MTGGKEVPEWMPAATLFDDPSAIQTQPAPEKAVARATDPGTSWAAANSVENLRESQKEILRLLKSYGPMTDEQIFARIEQYGTPRMSESGARTRRAELVTKKLVEDSGERGRTKSNRQTIIWRAT